MDIVRIFLRQFQTDFFRFLGTFGKKIGHRLHLPRPFVVRRAFFHAGEQGNRLFAVAVFERAAARLRFLGIIRQTGRVDEAKIAAFVLRERFRYLRLALFRQLVVGVYHFIIVKGGLRLVAHIEIIYRQSLVNIGEIFSRAIVHETEPAIDGGRIEFHVFVNVRKHGIDVPVPAVQGHFLVCETKGGEIIPFVVIFFRPFAQAASAEIDFQHLLFSLCLLFSHYYSLAIPFSPHLRKQFFHILLRKTIILIAIMAMYFDFPVRF